MGANPTQAQGVLLFFVALTLISVGLAVSSGLIWIALGLAALAISIALFLKCKPWEHREE
jgi:hypothetical protein